MAQQFIERMKKAFHELSSPDTAKNADSHQFIRHLKKDHDKQRTLAKQLMEAKTPDTREKLRNEFHNELYPHMIGEEASIFELLKSSEDEEIREAALAALQEHHLAKTALREVMGLSLESDIFRAKTKVLDDLNRHHMDEEEKEHFPNLQRQCSSEELDRLFTQYEEAEENASSE